MRLPELGIGISWFCGLDAVLQNHSGLIDLLEVEPGVFYRPQRAVRVPAVDEIELENLRQSKLPKLIHSVSLPVGGTQMPAGDDLQPLRRAALELEAPWLSEHLGFSQVSDESGTWNTGLLLPPRQTLAGVSAAVASVRALSAAMPVPVAIETGVNSLKPRADEIPDGEFVARVADEADCGVLLDLHNVWVNHQNRRQAAFEYVDQLPPDRIWEIHVAGGSRHRRHSGDAQNGVIADEVLELVFRIVPRLPNLKAIVFELFPAGLPNPGTGLLRAQLETLRRAWDRRGTEPRVRPRPMTEPTEVDPAPSPKEWEATLGALAIRRSCLGDLADHLRNDPGLATMRGMLEEFRGSMIVRTLRLSSRLIMLERGTAFFEQLLATFWKTHAPQLFACDEAEEFAKFLVAENPYVPFLNEVLEYDRAVIDVALHGEERLIPFRADPLPLLRALGAGRRPTALSTGHYEVRLTPGGVEADARQLAQMQVLH